MSERGRKPVEPEPQQALPIEQFRPTRVTLGLLLAVGVSAFLVHRDPWATKPSAVQMVSVKSADRRLFPNLGEQDVAQASIELWHSDRARVRLLPDGAGNHQVFADDTLLGVAEPEALDGLWSSLRMATTLRAVSPRTQLPEATAGIEVVLGGEHLQLELAGPTGDGSGHYGKLMHEQGSLWVVEPELALVLEQEPEAWLSRRLLTMEPAETTRVEMTDASDGTPHLPLVLSRGEDGLWRARHEGSEAQTPDPPVPVGPKSEQLLATAAVETRLSRLLGAHLNPFVERERVPEQSLQPWLRVENMAGSVSSVKLGPECPGDPDLRVVDRGPGLLGCVPTTLLDPWPLTDPDSGLAESQLVPHPYARIIGVDMRRPSVQRLRRRGGGWVIEVGEAGEEAREVPVSEPEVYRWYTEVSGIEVALGGGAFRPEIELVFETDLGRTLRVKCGPSTDSGGDDAKDMADDSGQSQGASGVPKRGASTEGGDLDREGSQTKQRLGEGDRRARDGAQKNQRPGQSPAPATMCQRDDGPVLLVRSQIPKKIVFTDETFRDRRLTELAVGDVRWLEIEPGPRAKEIRQSVRSDLGIWQLDAPEHPDGGDALDEVRVEGMLAAFASVRAEQWVDRPLAKTRLRTIRVGRTPTRTRTPEISLHLHEGCVVDLPDVDRAARISDGDCTALLEDVLYIDPLREWLSTARSLEVQVVGKPEDTARLNQREGLWYLEGTQEIVDGPLRDRLAGFDSWRAAGIAAGTPPGPARVKLRIQRPQKPVIVLSIGDSWVQLHRSSWYYQSAESG